MSVQELIEKIDDLPIVDRILIKDRLNADPSLDPYSELKVKVKDRVESIEEGLVDLEDLEDGFDEVEAKVFGV